MSNKLSAILDAEALNLKRGMINPCTVCPTCEGGRYKERSYSVGLSDDGVLWGKCWRASCGFTWSLNDSSKWLTNLDVVIPKKEEKKFEWPVAAVSEEMLKEVINESKLGYIWSIHEINALCSYKKFLYLTKEHRLVLQLISKRSGVTIDYNGYVHSSIPGEANKYRKTNLVSGGCALGIFNRCDGNCVVLVEDWFSAARLFIANKSSATLCGTELNQAKIDQLKAAGFTSGTLCLDYDASDKAIELARKWAPYFPLKVHLIPKDFKDMTVDEFQKYKP